MVTIDKLYGIPFDHRHSADDVALPGGATFLTSADKGVPNGIASLDGGGKVPANQLPNSVMDYLGNWDASTNTPTLVDGTGNNGDVYRASVAGTQNLGSGNQTFGVGDWIIYNGTIWEKSVNALEQDPVVGAVNGIVKADGAGAISAAIADTDYQSVPLEGAFVDGDKTKLDGIEPLAEVNNISDVNATDLTDGGDSILHTHPASVLAAHAVSHTDGTDDIQDASAIQKGLVNIIAQAFAGLKEFKDGVRITNLNTGDEILITDVNGDVQESGVKVTTAPAGGSGFTLTEYAADPVNPPAGFLWIQNVAGLRRLRFFDGTTYHFVDM